MHTSVTFKQWVGHIHDGRVKAVHYAGHLLHEKSFWGILAFMVLLAGLLTLIVLLGGNMAMEDFSVPYGPYY